MQMQSVTFYYTRSVLYGDAHWTGFKSDNQEKTVSFPTPHWIHVLKHSNNSTKAAHQFQRVVKHWNLTSPEIPPDTIAFGATTFGFQFAQYIATLSSRTKFRVDGISISLLQQASVSGRPAKTLELQCKATQKVYFYFGLDSNSTATFSFSIDRAWWLPRISFWQIPVSIVH